MSHYVKKKEYIKKLFFLSIIMIYYFLCSWYQNKVACGRTEKTVSTLAVNTVLTRHVTDLMGDVCLDVTVDTTDQNVIKVHLIFADVSIRALKTISS